MLVRVSVLESKAEAHDSFRPKETRVKERVVYLNGALVPESQAVISVFDRGVQYGDAVYDAAPHLRGPALQAARHMIASTAPAATPACPCAYERED